MRFQETKKVLISPKDGSCICGKDVWRSRSSEDHRDTCYHSHVSEQFLSSGSLESTQHSFILRKKLENHSRTHLCYKCKAAQKVLFSSRHSSVFDFWKGFLDRGKHGVAAECWLWTLLPLINNKVDVTRESLVVHSEEEHPSKMISEKEKSVFTLPHSFPLYAHQDLFI